MCGRVPGGGVGCTELGLGPQAQAGAGAGAMRSWPGVLHGLPVMDTTMHGRVGWAYVWSSLHWVSGSSGSQAWERGGQREGMCGDPSPPAAVAVGGGRWTSSRPEGLG